MKRRIEKLNLLVFAICLIVYSCKRDPDGAKEISLKNKVESTTKTEQLKSHQATGWQPLEFKTVSIDNGFIIAPTDGWAYAGYDQNEKFFNVNSAAKKTISCTCNTTGTCKPFQASGPGGSTSGCTGTCTNCTMKQSFVSQNQNIDISSGGYYLATAETRLLKDGEQIPAVFDALFEVEAFKTELQSFYKQAYEGKAAPEMIRNDDGSVIAEKGYSLVGLSIMGRGMLVMVPNSYAKKQLGFTTLAKASCSCSNGSCSLKDKTILGTGAVWCEGECTTCTLTTDSRSLGGTSYSIQLLSYRY